MRAIFGIAVVDAAIVATLLRSQTHQVSDFLILFSPIIILVALAVWIKRHGFRQGVLILEIGYSIVAGAIIWITFFRGEQDAGYQLTLLLIPFMGFFAVLAAGTAALSLKLKGDAAK